MEKKNIDKLLDQLKQNQKSETKKFCSKEEFKSKFYERIKLEDGGVPQKKFPWVMLTTSIAACFVVVVGVSYYGHTASEMFNALSHQMSGSPTSARQSLVDCNAREYSSAYADMSARRHAEYNTGRAEYSQESSSVDSDDWSPRATNSVMKSRSPEPSISRERPDWNTEQYKSFEENPFLRVLGNPLSTFGADVDTASYTNVRRYINSNRMPPRDAVRIEEFVNSFRYDYPAPKNGEKFSVTYESFPAPWNKDHKLLLIGVQGMDIPMSELPPANYVFLVDNSGSMYDEMDLVIESLSTLIDQMREQDKISLVTYGGGVNILLDGISGNRKAHAKDLVKKLRSGGYTPGSAGIQTAYSLAHKHFVRKGNNRIILITDGDFNVGVSGESELVRMVEKERDSMIYLSTFGVGSGNYQENKLKMLSNKGNGNYFYLDNMKEARKAMKACFAGRMFALAKDVKFQVEFNPAKVSEYRLLGYEMRKLADRDFNDDTKDSGEVGVGHQVTVLYELIPAGVKSSSAGKVDPLKYLSNIVGKSEEILTCKIRYQNPTKKMASELRVFPLKSFPKAGENIQWASAVAEFAMILRDSPNKGNASYDSVLSRAKKYLGNDPDGKRVDFLNMVHNAKDIEK